MKVPESDLLCEGLPTVANPAIGTVLVTGATGYIGGRLVRELLARGYRVRVMARKNAERLKERWHGATIVTGDALNYESLALAMVGVHTAYYLIHSLQSCPGTFISEDHVAAENFKNAAAASGIGRIIYLGGLSDMRAPVSSHLKKRVQVAQILKSGAIPVTTLRAAFIIGSGSAFYESLKHLALNMRLILVPRWAKTRSQPIALRDLVKYLVGVLEKEETAGKDYDIGGEEIYTHEEMLRILVRTQKKWSLFLPSPWGDAGFYAYMASLLTPVPVTILRCLMESCRSEVVCESRKIRNIIPFKPLSFEQAIARAMDREELDHVHSRWSDTYFPEHLDYIRLDEMTVRPRFVSAYSLLSDKDPDALFYSFCRVGGEEGWFHTSWLWRLRGIMDSLLMGVGTSRGRRTSSNLRIDDVIDFWRVEDLSVGERLLLRAEMKVPGRAWLGFYADHAGNRRRLTVTAYFHPEGMFGHLYWYFFLPFHHFIFTDMMTQIEKRSRKRSRYSAPA